MRYEGCDSDTTMAAKGRSPRRRREICRNTFTCISPWTILLRWFNVRKFRLSKTKFTERNWGKEKIDGDLEVPTDFSEIGKEASLNLGVGYGVINLVRNELDKMVELRRRIESLLQQFQTEIENQDGMPSRSSISSSSSSSLPKPRVQEIMCAEEHDRCSSPDDDVNHVISDICDGFRRENSLRMDQLEAELVAEFDRLHLPMDGELYAEELSINVCYEEGGEFCGVSPRDLESRLHQVLESRQQERIKELESALNDAMRQLEEKERELSL